MSNILLILVPVLAIICGTVISILSNPSDNMLIYLRNLTIGIVLGIISLELGPQIVAAKSDLDKIYVIIGIILGLVLLMIIRSFFQNYQSKNTINKIQWEMLISVAVDFFMDAFLIGITLNINKTVGLILAIALACEMFVLTLTISEDMEQNKIEMQKIILVSLLLIATVIIGFVLGTFIGTYAKDQEYFYGILSFGVTVLIWLIFEELLLYNSKNTTANTTISTTLLFTGFTSIIVSKWITGE